MEIYPVDNIVHVSHNRGQVYGYSFQEKPVTSSLPLPQDL